MSMKSDTYCMLLHLSQLLNLCFPILSFAVPIVMWAVRKDSSPQIDQHGKVVLNWLISLLIYSAVSVVLIAAFIGLFLLVILGLLAVIFPIIGGIKANDGILWQYPLSIKFFK